MEPSGDATGRGKGMGREPDLTLVPGGGVGKRMFADGGGLWSLSATLEVEVGEVGL